MWAATDIHARVSVPVMLIAAGRCNIRNFANILQMISKPLVCLFVCLFVGGQPSTANAFLRTQNGSQTQPKHPTPGDAVLIVDTDEECRLFLDDEDKGVIKAIRSQRFKVGQGEHILKCTIEAVPELVWRKVIDAKESSQVAAVITLRALHLQYDQAVAKVKSQKEESEVNATKQLAEAEAVEKLRKTEIDALPQKMFEQVKGHWSCTFTMQTSSFYYSLDLVSIEDGLIIGNFSTIATSSLPFAPTSGAKWRLVFKPEPGRLVGTGLTHCALAIGPKGMTKPGAKKDKEGYAECAFEDRPNTATVIVNQDALQFASCTLRR
jgi:hypothetical protein